MRALMCEKFGPIEDLKITDAPEPKATPGHVVIDVKAAGLNFPDVLCVQGLYQIKPETPFVPGQEGAGVVTEIGDGVDNLNVGDRVAFVGFNGAVAEKALVQAATVTRIPDNMPFEAAAGFTLVYATSYYALARRAKLKPGETLLVLGAAGGVGLATVELGKAMGARVIAAASTAEKLAVAREAGADEIINYAEEDLKSRIKELTGGNGVDVIYDPVGGDYAEQALRGIGWEGRYLVIGFAAGDIPKIPLNLVLLKGCQIVGVFWGAYSMRSPGDNLEDLSALYGLYNDGKINPRANVSYPLADAKRGFEDLAARRAIGKIVITM